VSMGAKLYVVRGHPGSVVAVAFSRDSTRIVSGSMDGTVRVWVSSTGTELSVFEGSNTRVNSVAFSEDDMRIVSCSDDKAVGLGCFEWCRAECAQGTH